MRSQKLTHDQVLKRVSEGINILDEREVQSRALGNETHGPVQAGH